MGTNWEGNTADGEEGVIYRALFEQAQIGTPAAAAVALTCTKSHRLCSDFMNITGIAERCSKCV